MKIEDVFRKSKLAGRHDDSKNMPPQKNYKTNSDKTKDNILKYKAGII